MPLAVLIPIDGLNVAGLKIVSWFTVINSCFYKQNSKKMASTFVSGFQSLALTLYKVKYMLNLLIFINK